MTRFPLIAIVVAVLAATAPATGTTIDLSTNAGYVGSVPLTDVGTVAPGVTSYSPTGPAQIYSLSEDFTLPTGFTNAVLNINYALADDSAVVIIDGVNVVGFGIGGPGNGTFYFTQNGPASPFNFALGEGMVSLNLTPALAAGVNTLTILVNNNNAGINAGGGGLTGGPTLIGLGATLTYNPAVATPEPAALALLGLGIGAIALARRRTL